MNLLGSKKPLFVVHSSHQFLEIPVLNYHIAKVAVNITITLTLTLFTIIILLNTNRYKRLIGVPPLLCLLGLTKLSVASFTATLDLFFKLTT